MSDRNNNPATNNPATSKQPQASQPQGPALAINISKMQDAVSGVWGVQMVIQLGPLATSVGVDPNTARVIGKALLAHADDAEKSIVAPPSKVALA